MQAWPTAWNSRSRVLTVKSVMGAASILIGVLLVGIAAVSIAFASYYKPTLEGPTPRWLTGEVFSTIFGMLLGAVGGLLLWTGGRWRRS